MLIEKTAINRSICYSPLYFLESARKGEHIILNYFVSKGYYLLLLPAYIGLSAKEGSGIYDPVLKSGIENDFYRINKRIEIDCHDLETKLRNTRNKGMSPIVLLVHYFGFPDRNIQQIVAMCRHYNAVIIEDCAHALYTDYVDHQCGKYGDFILYSIHKMLPYDGGGFLKVINPEYDLSDICQKNDRKADFGDVFNYDFYEISQTRKKNASIWEKLITQGSCSKLEIVRENLEQVTPQTYPVYIHDYDRTKLYFELNEAGFGAVSLYHTMIEPIQTKFEDSVWVSRHMMNLPVHQDIDEDLIYRMYDNICMLLSKQGDLA